MDITLLTVKVRKWLRKVQNDSNLAERVPCTIFANWKLLQSKPWSVEGTPARLSTDYLVRIYSWSTCVVIIVDAKADDGKENCPTYWGSGIKPLYLVKWDQKVWHNCHQLVVQQPPALFIVKISERWNRKLLYMFCFSLNQEFSVRHLHRPMYANWFYVLIELILLNVPATQPCSFKKSLASPLYISLYYLWQEVDVCIEENVPLSAKVAHWKIQGNN